MTADSVIAALARHRVIAIVRQRSAADAVDRARSLLRAGLRVLEVSLTTPDAWDAIAWLTRECVGRPDITVGVGTVLAPDEVARAADVGARFVISPVANESVIAAARRHGLAAIPGCATPTEMWQATQQGAHAVKIFPASLWNPKSLTGMLEALPDLRCVPTGGIALADVAEWLAAGALAVGVGAALTADLTAPLPWSTPPPGPASDDAAAREAPDERHS